MTVQSTSSYCPGDAEGFGKHHNKLFKTIAEKLIDWYPAKAVAIQQRQGTD